MGHLKRCNILGKTLGTKDISSILALDSGREALPIIVDLPMVALNTVVFDELEDANRIINLSRERAARLVIVDSYRITERWINALKETGIFVAVIDDLGIGAGADLRIDYSPGALEIEGSGVSLLGPSFFITNETRKSQKKREPERVLAHAGGTGNYRAVMPIYEALVEVVNKYDVGLDWLTTGKESLRSLESAGLYRDGHSLLKWNENPKSIWSSYDIVVGPASTSLFESIMQGAVPISFPISATQTSSRKPFLTIGHALHLTEEDVHERKEIMDTLDLAFRHFHFFRDSLNQFSYELDGKGAERVANKILEMLNEQNAHDAAIKNGMPDLKRPLGADTDTIRSCDLRDSLNWLEARNAPAALEVSSNPDHKIAWSEHLRWWMNSDTEKFVIENHHGPQAFFWHRAATVREEPYLIGGWFPSIVGDTSFAEIASLMQWQLDYCSEKYPHHTWVAIINKSNKAVLALNRYHGFFEASDQARSAGADLFPRFSDDFVVLQRKAYQ